MRDSHPSSRRLSFWRTPLFRLLAINLAIGILLAVFLVGGLLWLNPGGLRNLIFADRSPGTALGLLLFGFIVTFGSTAMGSAIMAMGQREGEDDGPRGGRRLVAQGMDEETQNGIMWLRFFRPPLRRRGKLGIRARDQRVKSRQWPPTVPLGTGQIFREFLRTQRTIST